MSNFLSTDSISFKFNSIAVIGVTIILCVFGYYEYSTSKKTLEKELETNAGSLIYRMQTNLPLAMWNFQTEQISQILGSELKSVYADQILVFEGETTSKLLTGKTIGLTGKLEDVSSVPSDLASNDKAMFGELIYTDELGEKKQVGTVALIVDRTTLENKLQDLLFRLIAQTLILDVIMLVMLTLLCKTIVITPINKVALAMEDIAQGGGDLTQRLSPTPGEIGVLCDNFNIFVSNIQELVKVIHQNMNDIVVVATSLSGTADQTSKRLEDQRSETELVATATHEMSMSATEVASNANEASGSAENSTKNIEVAQRVLNETVSSVKKLASDIDEGAEAISKVRSDVLNIGSVLDVIGTIAEQTNLLALNAAIEAARAGDQGRGFAVVADEVRTLANRTQESTSEIHRMLELLRNGAEKAVEVIETGKEQGQKTVVEANEAESSLDAITGYIADINGMSTKIACAVDEQKSVSTDISQRLLRISEVTETSAEDAKETTQGTNQVLDLCTEVKSMIDNFKT